ncbi:hypothetical protein QC763_308630 [Podospora pseudopauciseta]|uniref:Uncharacterized protein n=2 Tax=Podospora TaxID=5144 RepID=A0ABR0HHP4_9PEZI|nr:hypothetical protein QC763_308630 [Podospora pseudopauciseta]KAK4678547.1 hypothetical protein QC764_308630 [Podospora pseudoanserina]
MAWDSKTTTRRRQSSAASRTRDIAIHARNQSRQPAQPLSDHVADPFLADFLSPTFDPATYLNNTLPQLQTSRSPPNQPPPNSLPLSDLSITTQSSLSQLSAHTTRLTTILTQLTDEIIRSGSRLAYEVEVLRGETISLTETLTETLDSPISKFIPGGGIKSILHPSSSESNPAPTTITSRSRALSSLPPPPPPPLETPPIPDPEYISQLRTLSLVRSRLAETQATFGSAMSFVFPPSETSVSSSFLSVSAPDTGALSTEEKGQQVLKELRQEILDLLDNKEDPIKGVEDAAKRVEELKDLCQVWKGTAEERGRQKFVEGLARLVGERHERLVREVTGQGHRRGESNGGSGNNGRLQQQQEGENKEGDNKGAAAAGQGGSGNTAAAGGGGYGGYGLISQLQKLRGGI